MTHTQTTHTHTYGITSGTHVQGRLKHEICYDIQMTQSCRQAVAVSARECVQHPPRNQG